MYGIDSKIPVPKSTLVGVLVLGIVAARNKGAMADSTGTDGFEVGGECHCVRS